MAGEDEPRVEAQKHDMAVMATSEYLIQLIRNQKWCSARIVGQALEALVNIGAPTIAAGAVQAEPRTLGREERLDRRDRI
jgi:hypothetical protein